MEQLLDYIQRTAPGAVLIALVFILVRPTKHVRVVLYILTFVLLRDAMTPSSLWSLGVTNGVPWIRLFPSHLFLLGMGFSSLSLVALLVVLDKENSRGVVFLRQDRGMPAWLAAALGLAILLAPIFLSYQGIGIDERGGVVDTQLVGSILVFALFGNLLEELLFRGYVYKYFRQKDVDLRAGVISGFVFAACHVFLATTVTSVGLPILLFTLWEGVICGIVGARYGILPAAAVHGGAIFMLTSGLM